MGLLRHQEPARPDPGTPLSTFQARRLHQLVADAFRERTAEGLVEAQVVDERDAGTGLRDLMAVCATEPVTRWPELVRRHVGDRAAPVPTLEQLTDHTLTTSSVLRVVPAACLPPGWDTAALRLTEELVTVVAIDRGDETLTPSADALARRDPDRPWRQQAAANLRRLAAELPLHHERLEPAQESARGGASGGFDVVVGESGLTASLALAMDALLERLGLHDHGRGVLVGVPYRHQVTLRVVDGPGIAEAARQMADYVRSTFALAPGSISPRVHWVHDGAWRPVTRAEGDPGRGDPDPLDPEVAEMLGI